METQQTFCTYSIYYKVSFPAQSVARDPHSLNQLLVYPCVSVSSKCTPPSRSAPPGLSYLVQEVRVATVQYITVLDLQYCTYPSRGCLLEVGKGSREKVRSSSAVPVVVCVKVLEHNTRVYLPAISHLVPFAHVPRYFKLREQVVYPAVVSRLDQHQPDFEAFTCRPPRPVSVFRTDIPYLLVKYIGEGAPPPPRVVLLTLFFFLSLSLLLLSLADPKASFVPLG